MSDLNEAAAAELLLDRARRDRDEIEQRIAWLESLVTQYGGSGIEEEGDEAEIDTEAYGGMKKAVHVLMAREAKRLKMSSIADLMVEAGIRPNRLSAMSSARNAIRSLIKTGQVKKAGAFYKVLVAP